MSGKAKKLVKGSVLGGISFVLRILISLFMTPFMILSLGDHTYGLWVLVASFSGFYGILDFGLSTAVQRYMSRSVGSGDTDESNSVFNTSLVVFSGIGLAAMIMAGTIAWLAPIFVKSAENISLFRIVILIASVNIVIAFPMCLFWGILYSNLRYDISVWLEMANVVIKTIVIVVFLKQGFGIIAVALINLAVDMLWHFANVFYALKVAPYIRISFKYFEFKKIRIFLNYSMYAFMSQVSGIIKFNIDSYVISAFIGLNAVTVYSIGIRLIRYASDFLNKLVGLMTPVFSQYEGQGDFDAIREKFFFMFKVSTYIAVFFGFLLTSLARPFIERWVGVGYDESCMIVFILVVPTVLGMMMVPGNQLVYGISKHKFSAWVGGVEAVANLVLSLIFVQFWGIKGVALGTAIPSLIVGLFIVPIYTAYVLGVSVRSFYVKMFLGMIKSALVLSILYVLTERLIAVSFVRLIAFGVIQTICYVTIMFKIGLTLYEQDQLIRGLMPAWLEKRIKEKG
jgi:O-antigen/teichoic acid export membrane protein